VSPAFASGDRCSRWHDQGKSSRSSQSSPSRQVSMRTSRNWPDFPTRLF
jgi:hypothetical protein